MKAKKGGSRKPQTLEQVRAAIRGQHAEPTIAFEGDPIPPPVPTRFARFNKLVGGGLFEGAIYELFGDLDSGKTSFTLSLAADVQKAAVEAKRKRSHVLLTHFEKRRSDEIWTWRRTLGLDTSPRHFTEDRARNLEEGVGQATRLIRTGEVAVWIIDSVFAGGSREGREVVESWADPKAKKAAIGLEAKKWGEAWTALCPLLAETGTIALAINQERELIEIGRFNPSGIKQVTTPRGRALKFLSWQRLELGARQLDPEKWGGQDVDGRSVRIKVVKNGATGAARGFCRYDLIRGRGWDLLGDLIDLALECGAVVGAGAGRFKIRDKVVATSRDRLRALLEEREPIRAYVEKAVAAHLSPAPAEGSSPSNGAGDEPAQG